jgi:histidinol-phosphate phosphatase family protein
VFLDRDGTIIRDVPNLADPEQVELLPGAADRIRAINEAGWLVIVVTNQACIGRGDVAVSQVEAVHKRMIQLLKDEGTGIHHIVLCPHTPEQACFCRKPEPGMLYAVATLFQLDLRECLMIGDALTDMQAAKAVNMPRFKVKDGLGEWDPRQLGHIAVPGRSG